MSTKKETLIADAVSLLGNEGENWKEVLGASRYIVSDRGRVIRLAFVNLYCTKKGTSVTRYQPPMLVKASTDASGYAVVGMHFDTGEWKNVKVHRLVGLAFLDNPENKPTINHKDGQKTNNSVDNLEWASAAENNNHALTAGLRVSVKPVKCLDTGEVYASAGEAARLLGINSDRIREGIRNHFRLDCGYTFIWADDASRDTSDYAKQVYNDWARRSRSRNSVSVRCLDADLVFSSWVEAAKWAGVDSGAVERAVYAKTACRGHVFALADTVILDEERYMNYCFTRSRFYKFRATQPVDSLYDKAIVLLSGGVDSTTCLCQAVADLGTANVLAVSVEYNQKHSIELSRATEIANLVGVEHIQLNLAHIYDLSNCCLLAHSSEQIEHKSYAEQVHETGGKVTTYIPFRNGLFLSAIAAIAQSRYPDSYTAIYIGAHADDAAGDAYADCSPRFMKHLSKAIAIGTYNKVGIEAPFVHATKAEVVEVGLKLGAPYHLTWSCYEGGNKPCGKCGTCIDRAKAFELNGVEDPALTYSTI